MDHIRNYPTHGLEGFRNVKVVVVESPWRIYATIDAQTVPRKHFLRRVHNYDPTLLHRLLEEEIFRGSLVFVNIDKKFYRGTILDQTNNVENIKVWLGDYAIEVTVTLEDLYVMPSFARIVQWQVFACGLAGVHPIKGTEWSFDTCDAVRECLVGDHFLMRILYPDETAEAIWVDLLATDKHGDQVSIADMMLNVGHAQRATSQVEFEWGAGVGSFTDRRRGRIFDLKQWNRGFRTGIVHQDGQFPDLASFVVDEDEDSDSSQSHDNNDTFLYFTNRENFDGESNMLRSTEHHRDGFDSCGEVDDSSDIE